MHMLYRNPSINCKYANSNAPFSKERLCPIHPLNQKPYSHAHIHLIDCNFGIGFRWTQKDCCSSLCLNLKCNDNELSSWSSSWVVVLVPPPPPPPVWQQHWRKTHRNDWINIRMYNSLSKRHKWKKPNARTGIEMYSDSDKYSIKYHLLIGFGNSARTQEPATYSFLFNIHQLLQGENECTSKRERQNFIWIAVSFRRFCG